MAKLVLSDQEFSKLLTSRLRKRLKKEGFIMGCPEGENHAIALPINLDLNGGFTITRDEEGVWTFEQILANPVLEDRLRASEASMYEAYVKREQPRCR